ncbi:hypothetical protein V1509DRAFT_25828 [Lipomyces kononenkoae]
MYISALLYVGVILSIRLFIIYYYLLNSFIHFYFIMVFSLVRDSCILYVLLCSRFGEFVCVLFMLRVFGLLNGRLWDHIYGWIQRDTFYIGAWIGFVLFSKIFKKNINLGRCLHLPSFTKTKWTRMGKKTFVKFFQVLVHTHSLSLLWSQHSDYRM